MYEAPHIGTVGSVRGLTLNGTQDCYYGKTMTAERDLLGFFTGFPIGHCAVATS